MEWLWLFCFYSFLGYLLERMFAKITASPRQVRKGFLLLPLCPAYGLAMVADLAAADLYALSGLALFWRGMGIATVVEYLTHLFYDRVLGVSFWDYTGVPGCLGRGRICLPFSLGWGVLSAGAAVLLQPLLAPLARRMPPVVTYGLLLLLTADAITSASVLFHSRDTELLSIRRLRSRLSENREGPGSVTARDGH